MQNETRTTELEHHYSFRVRYAEVDAQGVVFNSRYLEYADIALTEFFRSRGIPFDGPGSFEVHVAQANVTYLQPLRYDQQVESWIRIARIGRSSIEFEIEFHLPGEDRPAARVALHYVHVDLETGQSKPVPPSVRAKLGFDN